MTEGLPREGTVEFGRFRLDLGVGELTCDGEPVALRPKAMSVLVELVAAAGVLVPKERLLSVGWGEANVDEESALHGVVREIRQALGDTAAEAAYVATVHRRGYRFVANVTGNGNGVAAGVPTSPVANAARSPWLLAAAVAVSVVVAMSMYLVGTSRPASSTDGQAIVDAPDQVLRARYLLETGDEAAIVRGAEMLRESVRTGGGALAWSGLAVAEIRLGRFDAAREAALEALAARPDDANAHRVLGQVALIDREPELAEGHLLRALELDPASGRAHHALAFYQAAAGEIDEAVAMAEIAHLLAPMRGLGRSNLARMLLYQRDYERAIDVASGIVYDEEEPVSSFRMSCLESVQAAAWMLGDYTRSRDAATEYIGLLGADPETLAVIRAAPPHEGAQRALRWRLDYHARHTSDSSTHHGQAAVVHGQLGESVEAEAELAKIGDHDLRLPPVWINDPRLDALRGGPELTRIAGTHRISSISG